MSWRIVVVSSSAKLDYQMGYLVVRKDTTTKIHLSEIGVLMIESTAVSLTAALLCELIAKKVKVIFCDEKRNPCSELVAYYGSHDTSMKIRKQIAWSTDIKTAVWTEIVTEKIRKQEELLLYFNRGEADLLHGYIEELEFGDVTNREGHAAKVYFNALFGKEFSRSADITINAALNYGYSIILSAFTREIVANGYITQLGLFHDNMFNPFNLASDLMEPFRPLVDKKVRLLSPKIFEHEEKMQLVDILNQEVSINERKEYVGNAIKIYCKSVFDALCDSDVSLIRFYQNEL
ncbi:MAG: type II CRISPR-associated endonuclease Cas1 [Roseburia sp.]